MKLARVAIPLLVLVSLAGILIAGRRPGPSRPPARAAAPASTGASSVAADDKPGLTFRLSEGAEEVTPLPPARPVVAHPLSDADTEKVLSRLAPLAADEGDVKDFALREKSLPPPRTGTTIAGAFPPAESREGPDATTSGPLQVLRHAPDGAVPLAPNLSITFSQPMVAVTSHDELKREALPVKLTPEPPGRWRWVGTKTLLFEPTGRFPMATEYRVEVPAGTASAVKGTLAQAVRFSFTTATPTLLVSYPKDVPADNRTLIFAGFDQKIDPAAVLATIKLVAGVPRRLRLATSEEIERDEEIQRLTKAAEPGRFLVFRAEDVLPADTPVVVSIEPGTPSAEGPRKTEKAQAWAFQTFGPFRVLAHRCGWSDECRPLVPWEITLSNPVDAKRFRKEMVRVDPPLPGLKVDIYDRLLHVRGASKGQTTYRVTLSADTPDVFDQTLGKEATVEFRTTSAQATLWSPAGVMSVLDPAGGARFSMYSINQPSLKVRAYTVEPSDWPAYRTYLERANRDVNAGVPPGRVAFAKDVPVKGTPDEMAETRIDLAPALANGLGHVILVVEPSVQPKEQWARRTVRVWIQVTRMGLTAFSDAGKVEAWVSALKDGAPLGDVALELVPGDARARTAADGLATLPLGETGARVLVARSGRDVAILPESLSWWQSDSQWKRRGTPDAVRWFVFDDRRMYRPGEEVRVKGWVRSAGGGPTGDIGALPDGARKVRFVLQDSRGNDVQKGEQDVSGLGSFDLALKLPSTMNLGYARLKLQTDAPALAGTEYWHTFEVQEFRRPEFEVTSAASSGPHFIGAHATVTVTASYYAGGVLSGAPATWRVTSRPGAFTPPNRDDFTFGFWTPWWFSRGDDSEGNAERNQELAAQTDAAGRHCLRIDFDRVQPGRPSSVHAEATVSDVNRQAWTASTDLLVHPADVYVGLKSDRLFVQKGEPLRFEAIVTDLDGHAVAGRPVAVHAERLDWEQVDGQWKETTADAQDCALTSEKDIVPCTFETKEGGTYRITATVTDASGRRNQTQLRRWVAGGTVPPNRGVTQEELTLVPSQKDYRAGDTAEILVLAPFSPAEGVFTLRRSGIFKTERFTMTGPSHTIRVKVDASWTPNVHLNVDLVGSAPRTTDRGEPDPKLPRRPAFAAGEMNLVIPPRERTLEVAVAPREKGVAPGEKTSLDVRVVDASGQPAARSEVAVVVVDEAILSLTGYRVPDPIGIIYAHREGGGAAFHSRQSVILARPDDLEGDLLSLEDGVAGGVEGGVAGGVVGGMLGGLPAPAAMAAPAPQGKALRMGGRFDGFEAKRGGDAAPEPIRMRADFSALALFAASVLTDAQGRAEVPLTLPDSLTRYRIMAVAVSGPRHFGKGESTVTARLPLMVRPSPPRFLNFGDRIELPVVLQNQTEKAFDVDVAMRARNAELTAGRGRRVTVPANDRVEIRFPVSAAMAGAARFQVGAIAGKWADAAEFKFPVWTPATTEAFATYGQIDEGAIVQPVLAPADVVPQFGGLEVTTSSTAVQALTDAVLYLVAYPFECAEQLSSRVIAVAALKDVLTAFKADGLPKPEEMVAAVDRDVKRLYQLQNSDGGFAFWRRGDPSWPYISIHVAHALQRAKEKGFSVPDESLQKSREYLRQIERHVSARDYGEDVRRTLIAYALYVRNRMGDRDAAGARKLMHETTLEKLSFEAIGWILPVMSGDPGSAPEVEAIRKHLANHTTETASTAHFAVSYRDGAHLILSSDRRADGVLLEALIGDQPKSDLIPKLVEGLLAHRVKGHWGNTQENAFILLALDRYFGTYEKITPDFVARAWLGDTFAGEHAFRGRTTERHHVDIPMRYVAEGKTKKDLVIAKDGKGRLYYRIGMQYAPSSLKLAPADHGFTVERTYEGIDRKDDVRRDADGTWHLKAGARVRVKLTMVAPTRRYHVALVDPLPAGIEAQNPALATTGTLPAGSDDESVTVIGATGLGGPYGPGHWWWWNRTWYEHQNLRDERVEAFSSLLWEGVYSYSYVARATTPGHFVVPPPKAEEMYHPETFGRGATDFVVVE